MPLFEQRLLALAGFGVETLVCGICGGRRAGFGAVCVGTITESELELDSELDVLYWFRLELENEEQYELDEEVDEVEDETELYEQQRVVLCWWGFELLLLWWWLWLWLRWWR